MAYQTSTNLYQNTKYVVDGTGGTPYTTIQSAINAANTAGITANIYVRPGTYTENLTLYNDISISGDDKYTVTISGTHTPPNAGKILFANVSLTSGTDIFNSAAAGTTDIRLLRCIITITNGYIYNLVNWTGSLFLGLCLEGASTTNGILNNTAAAEVRMLYCTLGKGTAKSMTYNGNMYLDGSKITCPIAASGAGVSAIYGGCFFEGTIAVSGTHTLGMSTASIITGATTALNLTTATPVILSNTCINTSNATAIAGTSTVRFATVTFVNSKGLAAGIVEDLTGVTKTGEIYADTILRMDMSGFYSWAAAAPYFDDTTLGTFQLLVGGTGYIRGKVVTWVAQNIAGMTSGATWYIYIDATGTIGKTSTRTDALFIDNIVLFECLYDETTIGGVKLQHTVRENHPYNYESTVSNYLHDTAGIVIENGGANIVAGTSSAKISITGTDNLNDHGLETAVTAAADLAFKKFYTDAAGKWALQNATNVFSGYYNNAGVPALIPANKYAIYTLYVSKDTGNAATPTYYAVMDTAYYNTANAATTAISNGLNAKATNELMALELCQLGYIIWDQAAAGISNIIISKTTLRSGTTTGGTNISALVLNNVTNFNGILSAADTNVQAALDTIDNWGAGTTDKCLVVGNGAGVALGVLAVGGTGTILTGVAANDPTWTTATYPADVNKGDVLVASADHVIGIVAGATTAGYMLTANGAATAPTFQTPSGVIWAVEAADMGAVANRGYIANKAGTLTFTLPAACAVGKTFRFTGINTATGWKIAQNAGQTIYFGATATTTGAAGYLQSTAIRDSVELVCVVADTDFNVVSSIGNITVA
jgi:hypothetical protein